MEVTLHLPREPSGVIQPESEPSRQFLHSGAGARASGFAPACRIPGSDVHRFGLPEKANSDYVRHGTTSLFAALEVATGKVTDACYQRHTHAEFLAFLKKVAKAHPWVKLHIVADNYSTQKHANVKAWLQRNPRVTMHFTPTSGSWMTMVEIFFGIITRQAIRRGTFTSVKELITAFKVFIDGWNERCEPFVWTKTADEILSKAKPRQ